MARCYLRPARERGGDDSRTESRARSSPAFNSAESENQFPTAVSGSIWPSSGAVRVIEAGARRAGPKLQAQLVRYFDCNFEDLFQIVLVDPDTGNERILTSASDKR